MTISYEKSPAFRGYMPLGVENTEGMVDGRDQIEYAAEYVKTKEHIGQAEQRRFHHRLKATNPWPDSIQPTLRPAIMEYVTGMLGVADRLRDAMCLALNVDAHGISSLFGKSDGGEQNFWSMKLVSYPPAPSVTCAKTTESFQGVGAHTDSNFLTLICQDAHSSGLQVQNVQGDWVDVPPTESNIMICNIGELSEVWSGGYFLATPHRVVRHTSNTHSRTSLPIFYNPKLDAVLEPINIKNLPWERVQQNQLRRKHNKLINCVGQNSFKSLARSHPNIFEKHHSDLTILKDGTIVKRQG